jgi:hypothetical protein
LALILGLAALFLLFLIHCPPRSCAGEVHSNVEAGYNWINEICFNEIHRESPIQGVWMPLFQLGRKKE